MDLKEIKMKVRVKLPENKMVPKGYYSDRFRGMSEKAKEAMAKAYLIRKKDWNDERWVDYYKDFLIETDEAFKDEGLKGFRTMACFYWERVANKKSNEDKIEKGWLEKAGELELRRISRGINS